MKALSPFPQVSPVVKEKVFTMELDWLNWIESLAQYVSRLLNRFDPTKSGIVTLVAGSATVAYSSMLATSYVRLTRQVAGGTLGNLSIVATVGVGFNIISDSAETSTILYEIVEEF